LSILSSKGVRVVRILDKLGTPALVARRAVPKFRIPNVLVVEASREFGPAFLKAIPKSKKACWIVGVACTRPLIGIDEQGRLVFINLNRCEVVLVDGQIDGRVTGIELVRALSDISRARILCIGITMWKGKNDELGAAFAIEKAVLLAALVEGSLSLDELLRARDEPQAIGQKLSLLKKRFRRDPEFRHKAAVIVKGELDRTNETKEAQK
jgi:hypothetical protein